MLEELKQNNLVYFIYQMGNAIYGLKDPIDKFLVIVDDEYKNKDIVQTTEKDCFGCIKTSDGIFNFIKISTWFSKIEKCDIEAWKCACLPKRFIHKEHVKLLMSTDPLKIRLQIDNLIKDSTDYCENIKKCKFAIQIIENHKIVNFKDGNDEILQFLACDSELKEAFLKIIHPSITVLKKLTDGILEKSKKDKIIQKGT